MDWLRSKPGAKWAAVADGVIPSWVADMDFPVARPIGEALERLAASGDLGYPAGNQGRLLEEKWAARMAGPVCLGSDGGTDPGLYRPGPGGSTLAPCRHFSGRWGAPADAFVPSVRRGDRGDRPSSPRRPRRWNGQGVGVRPGPSRSHGPGGKGAIPGEPPQPHRADAFPPRAGPPRGTGAEPTTCWSSPTRSTPTWR